MVGRGCGIVELQVSGDEPQERERVAMWYLAVEGVGEVRAIVTILRGANKGGGATPRVLGRQLPFPPPPPRGLRPTLSCQRCRPQASTGA